MDTLRLFQLICWQFLPLRIMLFLSLDAYWVGVDYPKLVLPDIPYLEWFVTHSLGPLLGVQWVEGGRVLGGVAHDNVQLGLEGEIDRLQSEVTHLQFELDGSEARFITVRVQWEHERDDLICSCDEAVQRLQKHLAKMSMIDTTPIDGAGTCTQGLTLSPDLDYRGWLDGDFEGPNLP